MTKRDFKISPKAWLGAGLTLSAALLVSLVLGESEPKKSPSPKYEATASTPTEFPRLRWPEGRKLQIRAEYVSDENLLVMDAPFSGGLEFKGELSVTGLPAGAGNNPRVVLTFGRVERRRCASTDSTSSLTRLTCAKERCS